MARTRYIVGIDLGTTNCAVAYVDTKGRERPAADIRLFEVPQLVAPGEVAKRAMLPSFLYVPGFGELPTGATRLPWEEEPARFVGEFARSQGSRVPGRLVWSAKSWLCHAGVDREAEILPWGAPGGVAKLSPVEASAELLRHLRDAWNEEHEGEEPSGRLEDQEVVLTVPASFDEAARELTVEAAKRAGFTQLTLLEEPQAAFYCWIVTHQEEWQKQVRAGELILVCDIGGGTTDFSLITVVETATGPGFKRVAVGDHLMLGGDNIDLTLAHRVESRLGGVKLDSEQWSILRQACRVAKEKLLGDEPPERWPVVVPGRGSRVIGGSLKSELTRDDVMELVLDGFLPRTKAGEVPAKGGRAGLQEFGLPFVSDPAISRHLAAFLARHGTEGGGRGGVARPDAILFNGGALTPAIVRERVVEVVSAWFRGEEEGEAAYSPRVLSNASLDLAVAVGAAYYGVVRRGGGIRIGGGTARSFYVGIEGSGKPWICVVPREAQEGDEVAIEGHDFELLMGQPVAFPLASSSVRPKDRPGDLVASDPETILELPPLVSTMRVGRKAKAERVPVRLIARVTEVGTVELWCQSRNDERRWRLQIQLRGAGSGGSGGSSSAPSSRLMAELGAGVIIEQSEVEAGCQAVREAFATANPQGEGGVSRLVKRLEAALDAPRDQWPPSALRALWEPLNEAAAARVKTPQHELRWLNLAGYCLRPGVGFPLDAARVKALWPVFHQGVKHVKDAQCWVEWWVLWRRVAAGLNRSHQDEVWRRLAPFLQPGKGAAAAKKLGRPKPEAHEVAEMWRCAAALERLPAAVKQGMGEQLLGALKRPEGVTATTLWSLGRLGARVPLYGPANTVVGPDVAESWATVLTGWLPRSARQEGDLVFALSQVARVSGDRARDLDEGVRRRVIERLEALGAEEGVILPVREYHELEAGQEAAALGDSLPVGLRLVTEEGADV